MRKIIIYFICLLYLPTGLIATDWKALLDEAEGLVVSGRNNEAVEKVKEALRKAQDEYGRESYNYAYTLSRLGEYGFMAADYKSSSVNLRRAAEVFEKIDSTSCDMYFRTLNNLSVAYQQLGMDDNAEPILVKVIKLKKDNFGAENLSYAKSLNNLGLLYLKRGKYTEAEILFIESLKIKDKLNDPDSLSLAFSYLNIGNLYKTMGNILKSWEYLEKSVNIFDKYPDADINEKAKAWISLAKVCLSIEKNDRANEMLERTKSYRTNAKGKKDISYVYSIYDLAMLKWKIRNFIDAEDYLNEAMEILESQKLTHHPLYSSCLNSIGIIYWVQDKKSEAEKKLSEALKLRKKYIGNHHPDYANTLQNYAGVLKEVGKDSEADQYYKEALELYLHQVNKYFSYLSENEKAAYYETIRERLDVFYSYVLSRAKDNSELVGMLLDLRLATKSLLLNSSKKVKRNILNSGNEKVITLYNNWIEVKSKLGKLYNLSAIEIENTGIDIIALEEYTNQIEKDLSLLSANFNKEFVHKKISWRDLQAGLKTNEACIELIRFNHFEGGGFSENIIYMAIIIRYDSKYPELVVIKKGSSLEELYINNYNNSIRFRIRDKDSYGAFWVDIDKKLSGINKIYLSPDGVYNFLNVSTFLTPEGDYLNTKNEVITLTNLSNILETKDKSNSNTADLFGFPDYKAYLVDYTEDYLAEKELLELEDYDSYKKKASYHIPELPGTKQEINTIEQILDMRGISPSVYSGDDASESKIKKIHGPAILHIASHGFFLSNLETAKSKKVFGVDVQKAAENPLLRSGILLAGAANHFDLSPEEGTKYENGVLTAYEAMNLNLDNTDLVVLSACETGLGKIKNGEGVYGLQRAFQVAGAGKVLMSLWKIDDFVTKRFMEYFYKYYISGDVISTALKKARQDIIVLYPHPYYWGAFVLVGY